jgi:3'-phosphoadenosine 5'-phosphosulfate sulfotransferase (PAPS reductase)/FAD synthetase
MLVIEQDRIRRTGACVRWADTGKHFPEMAASKAQIEKILGIEIVTVPQRIDFDTYLFERGGMLRKGANDCSRKMKRANLMRHFRETCWAGTKARAASEGEINLGFNSGETQRAEDFIDRNERDWCHWRFPLIEYKVSRDATWEICRKAGFDILVGMYEKMGRFDCYFCPNQTPDQARKVIKYYPELAA